LHQKRQIIFHTDNLAHLKIFDEEDAALIPKNRFPGRTEKKQEESQNRWAAGRESGL
jgi:hypothetical protein